MLRQKKLEKDENNRTRPLYEEIFAEDSENFVDYYYQYKASENEIYVMEEYDDGREGSDGSEVVSMLHLNPYRLSFCGSEKECHYIVAVATKERCRHQGMMKRLILASLGDMYERREPFTFLMPAAEAIYYPFGFRYMSIRRTADLKKSSLLNRCEDDGAGCMAAAEEKGRLRCAVVEGEKDRLRCAVVEGEKDRLRCAAAEGEKDRLRCVAAGPEDLDALSVFSSQYMEDTYEIYAVRSRHYFERLLKEQECEGGRIVLIKDGSGLAGYFLAPDSSAASEACQTEGRQTEGRQAEVREAVSRKELLDQLPEAAAGWLGSCEKIRFLDFGGDLEHVLAEKFGAGTEQIPLMMGRIVHLESLMETLRTEKQVSFYMIVEDEILIQNSGAYHCVLGNTESSCRRVTESEARDNGAAVVTAARLGEEIFKSKKIFLDEIV